MATNRITRGGARRRLPVAAALAPLAATLLAAAALAGCGGGSSSTASGTAGGSTTGSSAELTATGPAGGDSPDAAALNSVLSRQEAVVDAYAATIPHLPSRTARIASYFRVQEEEHVEGVLKAMRAAGVAAEPKAEPIDLGEAKSPEERLVFLYEVESKSIEVELGAISKLESGAARTVLAATVGNQSQHLVLLRRALGAAPLASVPEAFENGSAEPPA